MSSRPSSVRLRSALGKMDQADNTSIYSSTVTMTSEKASRSSRRTNGHHGLLNGTSYTSGSSTSTRSQSRTRGGSIGGGVSAMEVDDGDENSTGGEASLASAVTDSCIIVNDVTDNKANNNGGGSGSSNNSNSGKGVSGAGNNNNNNSSSTISVTNNEPLKSAICSTGGIDPNSMEVDSLSESTSSESSDSSDSEDSSEMDEQSSEIKKLEYQADLNDLDKQFTYLRELLYQERVAQITTKLEEVRSGKSVEYLSPLAQLQNNMRIRMEVTAKLRQFRLVNVQHKFDAEELAIRQNYESVKQVVHDSIKSDLEDKIRRLEEDRNNDFTSELWLETALKRKNKKSIDLFGDKKKKPVTVSGPYLVYMLNDVDIVEDWSVIKKALATPKRKNVEMVY